MGGNDTRFALCLDLAPYCQGGYVLNAILASMSQTQGTWQGKCPEVASMLAQDACKLSKVHIHHYSKPRTGRLVRVGYGNR
eukprot:1136268-Pelagomonas_calceolata.AAC.4